MRAELSLLEARLQYRFSNQELLRRALTHSSASHETITGPCPPDKDNEQLEFLGDSVLGFLITEALVQRHAKCREGELSALRAHLVSSVHLFGVARRLEIGSYLELGMGEEMSGGRAKKTLLVDALEALIAALYLDGGIELARSFVGEYVLDAPDGGDPPPDVELHTTISNFKSALQELAQSRKLPQPRYAIIRERGPEHAKTFTVEVKVGKQWAGHADGVTKKTAAQKAARLVYDRMRSQQPDADSEIVAG